MGKGTMFLMFIWMVVCIAGNVTQGHMDFVNTTLTADLTDSGSIIYASNTEGFPNDGIIVVGDEHIAYSDKTDTYFRGSAVQPLIRGADSTDAVAHTSGVHISTKSGAMLNSTADYSIAVMRDASGIMAFVAVPIAFFALLGSFFFLPLKFLGTDLQVLTYVWAIVGIGMIAAITMQMAGGRRI